MSGLDNLRAEVAQARSVGTSAITLLKGLHDQLQALIDAGNDDPALQALADDLKAGDQALSDAVVANTPVAAPAPAQPPPPASIPPASIITP